MIARQFLANLYGDEVEVEYYDAAQAETQERFAGILQEAEQKHLRYPLILINGNVRSAGGVDAYQLVFLADEDRRKQGLPARF